MKKASMVVECHTCHRYYPMLGPMPSFLGILYGQESIVWAFLALTYSFRGTYYVCQKMGKLFKEENYSKGGQSYIKVYYTLNTDYLLLWHIQLIVCAVY